MSGSDTALLNNNNNNNNNNNLYNNIERPYANVDLSKIPSWDLVMSIMEQQALEARRQMAKYHDTQMHVPITINNIEFNTTQYNYSQESDNSSYCSEDMDMDSTSGQSSSIEDSDISQSDSDIEIDVDSIEESDDYFVPSIDNIPITVLQLESKLREKEYQRS
jgi:hypothetical protein